MENNFPHNRAPLEVEFEVEFNSNTEPEPLPLGVRPFDAAKYHLQMHILPAEGVRHFTDFADTPADLLLREPDSHLSTVPVEGDAHVYRGNGATTIRDWYGELPVRVRAIVDEASFCLFCFGLTRVIVSRLLVGALVERWWDTTNSLHLSTTGEMTMTSYDFAMITGLGVEGDPIPLILI
ncbi:hypothetical protein ACSBR2_023191 [Camellia fascicularis]